MQSFAKVRARAGESLLGADDPDGGDGGRIPKPPRIRSRVERASDDGVWTAALFLALVAFLIPLWFLAVGMALTTDPAAANGSRIPQFLFLALGCIAIAFAVWSAISLARAPRLGRGRHRATLRRLAIVAGVLACVFLHRFISNAAGLAGDILAFAGAVAPAVLLAELSFALPAIAKHRYGTEIGSTGGVAWVAVAATVVAIGFAPSFWWLPTVIALVGSACTGTAAVRLWRRYEGRIVSAA
jgi:hypothetical protein